MIFGTIALIFTIFVSLIFIYNGLVSKKHQIENAFSSIDVQLKQRYDLIPNLINAVKSYMQHEQGVLIKLTELRSSALSSKINSEDLIHVNREIDQALKSIMVTVENYPELKANENFLQLQRSLNEMESQIAAARRNFNSAVTEYNISLETFPSNLIVPNFQ